MSYAIVIIALHFTLASSNQQHLICKTVEDVFSESRRILKNDTGNLQPASCGNCQASPVDYAKIAKIIDEKVTLEQSCEDQMGGFFNRSKCYTIPHLTSSGSLTYSEAVAECKRHGYLLAEIHDMTHQKTLEAYVRRKMPDTQSVTLWLGMEYKSMTSKLLYRSGKETSKNAFRWYSGFPESVSSNKFIIISVSKMSYSWYGMANTRKTSTSKNGVLCETL